MKKVGSFLGDWWRLVIPYFRSHEWYIAIALLVLAVVLTLASVSGAALRTHSLGPGNGESTVEGQHVVSLAYWTAQRATGKFGAQDAALADAIADLTAHLAYIRNPSTGIDKTHA